MNMFYTSERNTQMLIYLLKQHNIKKVIASPGATNVTFVGSIQNDPFFEIYSSVDERSAAYIACGLASESGEPVVLSCTGATASRNYVPGLTEAFYRKLPILAVTSMQHPCRIGNHIPQVIDRSNIMNDIAKLSVQINEINTSEDEWAYGVQINKALLELNRNGGGPVHINLQTSYSRDFSVKELPAVKVIKRIEYSDKIPEINAGNVGIFIGAHSRFSAELESAVDKFCEKYNGAVFCDQTSNYRGKYRVDMALVCQQTMYVSPLKSVDILIHIGEITGAYSELKPKQVWRVSPDGEVRDTFRKLTYVFQMNEKDFFEKYTSGSADVKNTAFYEQWNEEYDRLLNKISELPFSNAWIASQTIDKIPANSLLYLGILNSLRCWNFFKSPETATCFSNTGGFGIDGGVSTLLGMSLVSPDKLCFGVIGDLGFFYDMNALGNRHLKSNFRIMLINNGCGTEFKNFNHNAAIFGDGANDYIAAAGHYGNKSRTLVKHYAEDLGFEYLSACTKEEYAAASERFLFPEITDRPMMFEVFTDSKDESDALKIIYELEVSTVGAAKNTVKNIIGEKGVSTIKKILNR